MKINPWTYKIKDLKGEKIRRSFYEKELEHATGVDTSDLAAQKYFIALKSEADKPNINKHVNVPTSLNNFKIKADDLDIGKLKTVPADF